MQGRTLDYFILCIGPRKDIKPPLTLTDLHVLASRVRMGKRLYVIGFAPKEEQEHLRRLKPSAALAVWEAGYDERGRWDAQRAVRFAEQLAAHEAKAAAAKRARARHQRSVPASAEAAGKGNKRSTFGRSSTPQPRKRRARCTSSGG